MSQQFDVFAQLVATGNIAACARALDLPAASVIETMNSLEDGIGVQIFAIAEGRVELTEAGRKVVRALGELSREGQEQEADAAPQSPVEDHSAAPEAKSDTEPATIATGTAEPLSVEPYPEPVTEPDEAEREDDALSAPRSFSPFKPEPARTAETVQNIVLASHPAIFSHFQEALVAFEQASPDIGITLRLDSIDEEEAARLFREGLADIAYYYALGEPRHFSSRYAWSERISLFVSRDHPLAAKDVVSAGDLAALSYAALMPANIARRLAEEALAEGGLETGTPALETDDLYQIMTYIGSNSAYFAAFGPMARDFGRMSGIARLAYAQGLPQIQVRQAVRPDHADDSAILALSEFLFR